MQAWTFAWSFGMSKRYALAPKLQAQRVALSRCLLPFTPPPGGGVSHFLQCLLVSVTFTGRRCQSLLQGTLTKAGVCYANSYGKRSALATVTFGVSHVLQGGGDSHFYKAPSQRQEFATQASGLLRQTPMASFRLATVTFTRPFGVSHFLQGG